MAKAAHVGKGDEIALRELPIPAEPAGQALGDFQSSGDFIAQHHTEANRLGDIIHVDLCELDPRLNRERFGQSIEVKQFAPIVRIPALDGLLNASVRDVALNFPQVFKDKAGMKMIDKTLAFIQRVEPGAVWSLVFQDKIQIAGGCLGVLRLAKTTGGVEQHHGAIGTGIDDQAMVLRSVPTGGGSFRSWGVEQVLMNKVGDASGNIEIGLFAGDIEQFGKQLETIG